MKGCLSVDLLQTGISGSGAMRVVKLHRVIIPKTPVKKASIVQLSDILKEVSAYGV